MNRKLFEFPNTLKKFLLIYILVLTVGVSVGLVFVSQTTGLSSSGAVERFRGSDVEDEFEIAEQYPKSINEMLMTTHNHILGFSFIFLTLGTIFYFNSVVTGFWKSFLIIEPLISTLITFGSIWGMRFIHESFVYLTILSSTLLYLSFFAMAAVILFELIFKKKKLNH